MGLQDFLGMDWDKSLQNRFSNPTSRYPLLTFVTAVIFAELAALFNPSPHIENIRALLTALALAEASILAIIFSVTAVALQLVVTRYPARLTSLFIKDALF